MRGKCPGVTRDRVGKWVPEASNTHLRYDVWISTHHQRKAFTSRSLYSDNTAAKLAWLLPHLSVFNWLHITCI
jgi:hypothetical protein